jgi:hypothetical protein
MNKPDRSAIAAYDKMRVIMYCNVQPIKLVANRRDVACRVSTGARCVSTGTCRVSTESQHAGLMVNTDTQMNICTVSLTQKQNAVFCIACSGL